MVSGVIGTKVPAFDLWGDTVNLASRLESEGYNNTVQVSEATYWRVQHLYEFDDRGEVDLKGDIKARIYVLKGRKLLARSGPSARAEKRSRPILRTVD